MKRQELIDNLESYLLEEKEDEKAAKTLNHYKRVLQKFIDSLPNEQVSKIDLIKYKDSLIENFKPRTVNNYITIINKYIKYLEIKDDKDFSMYKIKKYYTKNALKNIKIQNEASLEEVLEPGDLKRMLNKASRLNQMDMYYIMKIIAYTGIRVEELKVFTVENIQSNYIKVSNKGKTRNVILRSDLRRDLLKYCEDEGIQTGFIFPGKKAGTMIHATTIFKKLKHIAGECKIKKSKVHAHSFRHLFAIKFISEGGDISELADILGHSSIQTTRIYTRTTDSMKKKRLERMKY